MKRLPAIYTIRASDAPQHTGRLQEILQKLKTENRIANFTTLGVDDDLSSLTGKTGDEDLILVLLTSQLEPQKEQIENRLKALKANRPGLKVAEIIVDNLVYENEFITFPADLKPVRDREDMDAVWSGIGQSLKDMFPPAEDGEPFPWKKYVKYAALILLVAVLIWVIPMIIAGKGPEAHFIYYVDDVGQDTVTTCYPPCDVQFINESRNFDSSQWQIGDTVFTDKHLRLEFRQPGEIEIVLTAFKKKKKNTYSKNLLVKTLPFAGFEVENNGCTAPCRIEFINTSSDATSYAWNFGNRQTSEENQPPEIEYEEPGRYRVKLTVKNDEGITADTIQIVTIIPDDSPFSDFSYSGTTGRLPRKVTFENTSKNADSYVWQFPDGSPSVSSSKDPVVTYSKYGTYSVTLTVKKNDGRSHQEVKAISIRNIKIVYPGAERLGTEAFRKLEMTEAAKEAIKRIEATEQ